jgi:RND superfamily putative drug exporter
MLKRLGRFCHDRRGVVLLAWLAALLVIGGITGAAGTSFSSEFSLPDVESADGLDMLEEHFGGQGAGLTGTIVFAAEQGVTGADVQVVMSDFFARAASVDGVSVTSPYGEAGANQIAQSGEIAFAAVELPRDASFEEATAVGNEIKEMAPEIGGLQIEYGGDVFAEFEPPQSEILGLAFAIVILILAFGSVLAMGLPIGTALFGIGIGTALVSLLSHLLVMPDFTTTLGVMIGLGVGIDYALFIVTRYREGMRSGIGSAEATVIAIDTAGRAVLFAGTTVVISLLGMILMGVSFTSGLGIGAAVTVAVTMVASVTLLPALLGFAGYRVELTRWRGLIAAGLVAVALVGVGLGVGALLVALPAAAVVLVAGFFVGPLKAPVPRRAERPVQQTLPYRWSRMIQSHPWVAVISGVVVLVVLASPVLSLRLGFSDAGNYPEESTTRKAYDLLAEGFGPGFNGPLLIAATLPEGYDPAQLEAVTASLNGTDGVQFATPAIPNDPAAPAAVLWTVYPETSPQDEATTELVATLREEVLPSQFDGSGVETAVTGQVAIGVDFSEYLASRLPLFLGVVLALSFVLLMAVFRSILVPLKAVIMNLISIAAAYGVVVAIFQWGWGAELIGVGASGPIEPFVPMMMFAIVFGLSMDYEVFLLSRVKEEYDGHRNNGRAVADGLATTARVITAAAAIMVFVFGSFVLESDRVIKLFGLSLATAILLDASIVRMLLVPATMELLGDRNWWLPKWLDRILPKIDVEGAQPGIDRPGPGTEPDTGEKVRVGV